MGCCEYFPADEKCSTTEFAKTPLKRLDFSYENVTFSMQSRPLLSILFFFCCPCQAAFRTDLSVLLDQVGAGKESLSFMKRRIRRLAPQWTTAANRLDAKLEERWRDQKKVRPGFLRVRHCSHASMTY